MATSIQSFRKRDLRGFRGLGLASGRGTETATKRSELARLPPSVSVARSLEQAGQRLAERPAAGRPLATTNVFSKSRGLVRNPVVTLLSPHSAALADERTSVFGSCIRIEFVHYIRLTLMLYLLLTAGFNFRRKTRSEF